MTAAMAASALAIDFTPRESVRELDGARFSELIFTDGHSDVSYEPPAAWSYHGEKNLLTLWEPARQQVDARIVVTDSGVTPIALDGPGMKLVRARAQSILPRGSEEVRFLSEAKNAVMIDGQDTYEATFEYGLFGQMSRTCVLFAFLGNRLVTIQVSAHPEDFAEAYRAFHRSLFSLQWHKAGTRG